MFGFIRQRELDDLRADVGADPKALKRAIEELEHEWAGWYDKYRSLYARLVKREQKTAEDAPGDTIHERADPQYPPLATRAIPRSAHLARRFKIGG